jgi:hypothetical protein
MTEIKYAFMSSLQLKNSHPRDAHIYMDEATHTYYLDGSPISISGTGFLHLFFEPFDGPKMAENIAKKAKPGSKYFGLNAQQILSIWEEGTRSGTLMHKNIEDFLNGTGHDTNISNKENFGLFKQCLAWMNQIGLEPYRTEWIIYDEDYDIAGSIDFVGRNRHTGQFWIIDWKRSNELRRTSFGGKCGNFPCHEIEDCNGWHYQLQVNLYRHILEKHYDVKIEQCVIVNLHPNHFTPDILMAEDMQPAIMTMLNHWNENKSQLLAKHKKH